MRRRVDGRRGEREGARVGAGEVDQRLVVGVGGGLIRPMQQRWEGYLSTAEREAMKQRATELQQQMVEQRAAVAAMPLSAQTREDFTRFETAVDIISIGFFAYMAWLMWRYIGIVGNERMVTVDLPRGIVFYTVFVAFVLMLLRGVQNFIKDMRGEKTCRENAADHGATGV